MSMWTNTVGGMVDDTTPLPGTMPSSHDQAHALIATLRRARKTLGVSGATVARARGVKPPVQHRWESESTDTLLSTAHSYALAMGAHLSISVVLPDGTRLNVEPDGLPDPTEAEPTEQALSVFNAIRELHPIVRLSEPVATIIRSALTLAAWIEDDPDADDEPPRCDVTQQAYRAWHRIRGLVGKAVVQAALAGNPEWVPSNPDKVPTQAVEDIRGHEPDDYAKATWLLVDISNADDLAPYMLRSMFWPGVWAR